MPNIRPIESISVQGCAIKPGQSVVLKPCKKAKSIKNGILRVHNMSDKVQILMPSKAAQKQWPDFLPEIKGDDKQSSLPMAWDNPSLRFEIISLPDSILPSGDRILINSSKYTSRGSTWTMKELVSAVKAPPGSVPAGPNNPKNYMGYDRTNWQLFKQEIQSGVISGVDMIILNGKIVSEYECNANEVAYIFETLERRIAFVVENAVAIPYTFPDDNLRYFLDDIGTSGCISLLQKAIRRRPAYMRHPETQEVWKTEEIVSRIAQRYCRGVQQGFFLPVIGKFVSGHQHFLKRLFVIAAEDSSLNYEDMFAISSFALLASLQPLWSPSESVCQYLSAITVELLMTSVTTDYDASKEWIRLDDFIDSFPSRVHESIGGMKGDQNMLRWLECNSDKIGCVGIANEPLLDLTDPLDIYCDQHQDGRLVCLLGLFGTFPETLSTAFQLVSGFNTRRTPITCRSIDQQMVFDALKQSSKMQRGIERPFPITNGPEYHYELDIGAIAGMVGTIEIAHKRAKYFVTISSRDIRKFIVIPKPTRDNKRGLNDITPQLRDQIVERAKIKLKQGRKIIDPIEPYFKGKRINYQDGEFWIDGKTWLQQRIRSYRLVKRPEYDKINSATIKSVSWTRTFGAGRLFSEQSMQFALGRMAGYSSIITIPKINREGKGTDEALTGFEVEAYQYLDYLSEYFPDAIYPCKNKPFAFESRSVAFRKELCKHLRYSLSATCSVGCLWPKWTSNLKLNDEQELGLAEMTSNHRKGFASFLWMLVGQGKTLTVLKYLDTTRSCKYIIWSLPKTAVGSVASQIKEVGFVPIQIYPSKGLLNKHTNENLIATTNTTLNSMAVHLIEHDHLRSLADHMATQMSETAFIFDEVHKAMQAGTKRTASALRLARIAKQLVALTGTPIVDKSGYGLIQWLKLCVPYPISAKNFWVAANSMISPLNTGNVKTEEIIIQAHESDEDKSFFRNNFPERAPWYGKTPFPTVKQWQDMRMRTNYIVTEQIVNTAAKLILKHHDNGIKSHKMDIELEKNNPTKSWELNHQRPLIVASSQAHVVIIVNKLLKSNVQPKDILCVGGIRPDILPKNIQHKKTIHLTEQAVITEQEQPFKVVIAALRYCEGYSLTWCTCMITGCYPSNQASRTQMKGRINRLDAQRLIKRYITILGGVTSITYRYQEAAKLMEDALRNSSTTHKQKKMKSTIF